MHKTHKLSFEIIDMKLNSEQVPRSDYVFHTGGIHTRQAKRAQHATQ